MKRTTLIFVILLYWISSSTLAQKQSLEIRYNNSKVKNGDTLTFMALSKITAVNKIKIINKSSGLKKIKCKKIERLMAGNSQSSICWAGQCYPPSIYTSISIAKMNGNDTVKDFLGDYYAKGSKGVSFIEFVFFDVDNPKDSSSFVAKFNGIRLSSNQSKQQYFVNVFPTVTNDFLHIQLPNKVPKSKFEVELYDLQGKIVLKKTLQKSYSSHISINHLPVGCYIVRVFNKKKSLTKKVFKH